MAGNFRGPLVAGGDDLIAKISVTRADDRYYSGGKTAVCDLNHRCDQRVPQ
jgi:hypothetical protein